jgi:hypothetical protein
VRVPLSKGRYVWGPTLGVARLSGVPLSGGALEGGPLEWGPSELESRGPRVKVSRGTG